MPQGAVGFVDSTWIGCYNLGLYDWAFPVFYSQIPLRQAQNHMHYRRKLSWYLKQLPISLPSVTTATLPKSSARPPSQDLGIDSLDTVEMLMDLEDQLGMEIELDQKVETVGDLVDFIESKQG